MSHVVRSSVRVVRGIAATALLLTLLIAVPMALVRGVGWPLPTSVPSIRAVVDEIERRGISDDSLVKVLAVVVWVAWARFSASVVVEMWAALRRRPARTHRVLGGSQRVASSLVAAVVALTGLAAGMSGAGAATYRMQVGVDAAAAVESVAPAIVGRAVPAVHGSTSPIPAPVGQVWVVSRNDSLWGIAEATFGDGARWREIAAANHGHEVAPGVVFDAADDVIRPGWTLAVPANPAAAIRRLDVADSGVEHVAVEVEPGSTVASAASAPIAPATNPEPTEAACRPVAAAVPVAIPVDDVAGAPAGAAVGAEVAAEVEAEAGEVEARTSTAPAVLGLGLATLLGTGAIGYVSSARRRRLRAAGRDVRLPRADGSSPAFEMTLRSVSADERMARVDIAVRAAVAHLSSTAQRARVVVVTSGADGAVEVHLDRPALMVPPGFVSSGSAVWTLAPHVQAAALAVGPRFAVFPCPALTQLGRRSGGDVLVDLEAVGLLAVTADGSTARDLMRSMVASITFSPFGENVGIVVVGDADVPSQENGAVERVADLDAAIDRAADLVAPVLGLLSAQESTAELRMRSAGEAWDPVVVASFGDVPRSLAAELPALADPPGRGLAIVLDRGVPDAPWRVVERDGTWRLEPLGIDFEPCGLTAADGRHLSEMIADARQPLVVLETTSPANGPRAVGAAVPYSDAEWTVMVRMLGPLDVVDRAGSAATFERAKSVELVAWLTEHRDGATRSRARAALWGQAVQDSTFANVVSDARRGLAALVPPPLGDEWVGRTLSELLPLHPLVTTDAALLTARRRWATGRPAIEAIDVLRPGLELVRDSPFSGSGALWPDAEGVVSNLILLVVGAATDLAERYLEVGDHDGLFWATAKGLLALPGHEGLIALRMRAHADADDLAGVRTEWESYERVLAADPWGDASPAAKLVELRRTLLSPSRLR